MRAHASSMSHVAGCGWFWGWALVGAGYGLGISVVGLLTIPLATVAVVFMTRRRPIRGAFGVATGVGAVFLYVAYRGNYDTLHWFIPGIVLFAGGIAAQMWAGE